MNVKISKVRSSRASHSRISGDRNAESVGWNDDLQALELNLPRSMSGEKFDLIIFSQADLDRLITNVVREGTASMGAIPPSAVGGIGEREGRLAGNE